VTLTPSRVTATNTPEPAARDDEPITDIGDFPPGKSWRPWRDIRAWMVVPPVDAAMLALPALWAPEHEKGVLSLALLTVLLLGGGRCYRARLHTSVLDELPWLMARLCTAVAVVAVAKALRHEVDEVVAFLGLSVVCAALFVAGRIVTTTLVVSARRRGWVAHRTLVVGGGPLTAEIVTLLRRHPRYGLAVAGVVGDDPTADTGGVAHLGRVDDLRELIDARGIATVLLVEGDHEDGLLDAIARPGRRSWELLVVPRLHQLHTQVGLADHIGSIPVMRINRPALVGPAWALKRLFDVLVSALALVVLAPLMALVAVAVRLESGPGVLFRQERVGRGGALFTCLKFRSMRPATSAEAARRWSIADDHRVGPVGRVLRRFSLDELPQLWNILRGDMTLVGPRPERPYFVELFSAEVPRYVHRHRVRAGLTGFAQVSGLRGDTPIVDRARFDNYYIENWSLWMDFKVIVRTIGEVLGGGGR
jgi:exopolysaccharide biosynthesis polyprenyl glycosylphosphotransferase